MNFKELAEKRFSVRRYTSEPVSKADIDYILECARLAPSAHNKQPWKFLLVTSDEAKVKIRQCYNRPWFPKAQVYVLAMKNASECWVRPDDNKSYGDVDLGIVVEHIVLAAADRGLGSCWVANYDVEAVKRLFPVEGYEAVAIIPIGHIDPEFQHHAAVRKDMSEIVEKV